MPLKGKHGYKGHGAKIFFNARNVKICSKENQEEWGVELNAPLTQLEEKIHLSILIASLLNS